ncbi:MAG: ArsB/NhaD family transporter [Chloroflexi bacterium]|nr:ArsB/NhaD family transporter [Chloroflexota bacterium]
MEPWIALAIFVAAYAAIASDRVDRTLAALLGAVAVILVGITSQEDAFAAVDWNVIFLLAGMMIIAGVLRRTGVFGWLAVRTVRLARGEPLAILLLLAGVTAVLSAFLDNVTTIVLLAPVTLYIATTLRLSPVPFLVAEVLASNIGGAATLIGDPPNILIGSASGLTFVDFLVNLGPVVVIIFAVFAVTIGLLFRGQLAVPPDVRAAVLALDESEFISDRRLLRLSLAVLALTIAGFLFAAAIDQRPATIALLGAAALLLVARLEPDELFREIDWSTLLFFVGLFVVVHGLIATGVIATVGRWLVEITGGNQAVATLGLLWVSGGASALVDNIPYTATMIPVVQQLGSSGLAAEPLWWALALGACLGGNATIVGASANIVAANAAARAGHPITFGRFLRVGGIVAVLSLVISSGYVWLRYLL